MTAPKTDLAAQLKKLREDREAQIAAFEAAQAAEIAALKASSEAEAAAAAKAAEEAAKLADEADARAAKAEADAKAAREKHAKLFPTTTPVPARRPLEVVTNLIRNIMSGWLLSVLVILLAVLVWVLFPRPEEASIDSRKEALLATSIALNEQMATAIAEPTAVATVMEPTAVAAEAVPTEPKPAAEAPKPTAAKAPAPAKPAPANPAPAPVPGFWNSGPSGKFQPKAGTICHGDLVGPYGSVDGTKPVVVKFWADQPAPLDMVWSSCEWGTGRTTEQVKAEVDAKYGKTFEIVNN